MTAQTFKAGETVRQKSGGPLMTIDAIEGNEVIVSWFHEDEVRVRRMPITSVEPDDGTLPITILR